MTLIFYQIVSTFFEETGIIRGNERTGKREKQTWREHTNAAGREFWQ
jgi:hypothetical protein